MASVGLGDMAQTFILRRMTTTLKQGARAAAQELTSGKSADTSSRLRGDFSLLNSLAANLSKLDGYRVATDSAALKASALQTALQNIDTLTDGLGVDLLNVGDLAGPQNSQAAIKGAAQRFDAVISTLNTTLETSSLFAGVAGGGGALATSDTILLALEAEIAGAGATTANDMEAAITSWFETPSGFASIGYLGGTPLSPFAVSPDESVALSVTAADPAIRDTLKALAISALVDRGTAIPDQETGHELARHAGTLFLQSSADRAYLAGQLGLTEARIEHAQTRNQAERTALQSARSNLLSVDPFDAATRMEEAQNQLETLYSVTARLSRLSLVDFLR